MYRDLKEGEIIRRKIKEPLKDHGEYIYAVVVGGFGMRTDSIGNALFVDQSWSYDDCRDKNNLIRARWSRDDDIEVSDSHEQA